MPCDPEIHISRAQASKLWYLQYLTSQRHVGSRQSLRFLGLIATFRHLFSLRKKIQRRFRRRKTSWMRRLYPYLHRGVLPWDISPTSISWANDDQEIYVEDKERAREKLWRIPATNLEKKLEIRHFRIFNLVVEIGIGA